VGRSPLDSIRGQQLSRLIPGFLVDDRFVLPVVEFSSVSSLSDINRIAEQVVPARPTLSSRWAWRELNDWSRPSSEDFRV
jgi:hypothetical protein